MINSKRKYQEIIADTGVDSIVGLDRMGNEVSILAERRTKPGTPSQSMNKFPIVVDEYVVTRQEQVENAKKYRDRIEYIYSPELDSLHPMLATWRLDDTERLKTTLSLPFGEKILEAGCSSGTVSIEIAKLVQVKEVVGIDIRPDAISIANDLISRLQMEGKISDSDATKVKFIVSAIEDLKYPAGYFDSVCAFEILEHLTMNNFHQALKNMIRLLSNEGTFFMSVPNRYPDEFYNKSDRSRWSAPDHKNYFSISSLEYLLKLYFKDVQFYSIENRPSGKGVYLMAGATSKLG